MLCERMNGTEQFGAVFGVFRERFALDMFKKHTANEYDSNLVISMFNRTVTFEENDKELFLIELTSYLKPALTCLFPSLFSS